VAERMKFTAWAIFIAIWSVVVYAPMAHWVWSANGFIFKDIEAVGFQRQCLDRGTKPLEQQDRAIVGRRLDDGEPAFAGEEVLDDERHALVKPGGRNVPYAKVRAVLVTDRGATIDVFVKQGWLHTTALVECAGADRKAELLDELRKRFPDRVRMRGRMVSFVPVLVVLLALSAALAGMHLYLHQRFPALRASVQPLERLQEKARKKRPPLEYVEAFGFTPLRGLRYLGEEKGELYFEDKARKFRLKVMPGFQRTVFERQAVLFRYAMGVRDYEDLLALSYHSRFGVIPLYLRALDLAGLEQAAVYEIGPPVSGFIKQGRRDQVEETRIVMFGSRFSRRPIV